MTLCERLRFGIPTATTLAQDRQGVDFTTSGGVRWAWRSRDARYLPFADITVRCSVGVDGLTERGKLAAGACDYALWTWTATGTGVSDWLVLSVPQMRPLLRADRAVHRGPDAAFVSLTWAELYTAGTIYRASSNIWKVARRAA